MPQSDKAVAMVTSCYGDLVCVSNLCTKLRTYNQYCLPLALLYAIIILLQLGEIYSVYCRGV